MRIEPSFYESLHCFCIVLKITVWDNIGKQRRWFFPSLLILSAILHEVSAAFIMFVISDFYKSISSLNKDLFIQAIMRSLFVVVIVSFFKSLILFATESCALQWRIDLVFFLHYHYFDKNRTAFKLLYMPDSFSEPLDNCDQRITQDVLELTLRMSQLLTKMLTVPGIIVYYTYSLWNSFSWFAPTLCYVYFLVSSTVSVSVVKMLAGLIFQQEIYEANFRFKHAYFRINIDSISFLRGEPYEGNKMENSFEHIQLNQSKLINRRFVLHLLTNWFSYIGTIVNYVAIGVSIFAAAKYASQPPNPEEIAASFSRGSYACLYLISAFSMIFDSYALLSEIFGYSRRISGLVQAMRRCAPTAGAQQEPIADQLPSSSDEYESSAAVSGWWLRLLTLAGLIAPRPHPALSEGEYLLQPLCRDVKDDLGPPPAPPPSLPVPTSIPAELPLLIVTGLDVYAAASPVRGRRLLLRAVSWAVLRGERLLLTGPSGCGKSCLLRLVAAAVGEEGGAVSLTGPPDQLMFLPQTPYCFQLAGQSAGQPPLSRTRPAL